MGRLSFRLRNSGYIFITNIYWFYSSLTLMAPPKNRDNFTSVEMFLWKFPSELLNRGSHCFQGKANACSTTWSLKYSGSFTVCSSLFNIDLSRINEEMLFRFPSRILLLRNSLPILVKELALNEEFKAADGFLVIVLTNRISHNSNLKFIQILFLKIANLSEKNRNI